MLTYYSDADILFVKQKREKKLKITFIPCRWYQKNVCFPSPKLEKGSAGEHEISQEINGFSDIKVLTFFMFVSCVDS